MAMLEKIVKRTLIAAAAIGILYCASRYSRVAINYIAKQGNEILYSAHNLMNSFMMHGRESI
jgi:hypothetical protein